MQQPKLLTMTENLTHTPQLVWRIPNEDLLRAAEAPFEVRRNVNPSARGSSKWKLLFADRHVASFPSANRAMIAAANIHTIFRGRDAEASWTHPLTTVGPMPSADLPPLPDDVGRNFDNRQQILEMPGWHILDDGTFHREPYLVMRTSDLGCVVYKIDSKGNACPVHGTRDLIDAQTWVENDEHDEADQVADAFHEEEEGDAGPGTPDLLGLGIGPGPIAVVETFTGSAEDTTPGGKNAKS